MTYQTSQQLADIILKNGYKEITSEKYPAFHKLIIEKGYESATMKRVFTLGPDDEIKFNYDSIEPKYQGRLLAPINSLKNPLTKEEVISIIAFFKLPFQTKKAYRRHSENIPDLYKKYNDLKQSGGWHKKNGDRILVETFESVVLD